MQSGDAGDAASPVHGVHASLEAHLGVVGVLARAVRLFRLLDLEHPRERVATEHGLMATRTRVDVTEIQSRNRFDHLLVSPYCEVR